MNRNRWPGFALLVCVALFVFGCREKEPKTERGEVSDVKSQIFNYLAKKAHQKQFAPGIDLELPRQVALLRSNAIACEQRVAALRASLRAVDNASPANDAERAARNDKRPLLERELREAERQWEAARSEATRKREELSHQEDNYIRAVRQKIGEVRSYEILYRLVGEQLATADRLLLETEPGRRRTGLKLAREACNHVNSGAVDVWLAARICEAYFWPNLDVADPQPWCARSFGTA